MIHVLRWLAALPAAILMAGLAQAVVHLTFLPLYSLLGNSIGAPGTAEVLVVALVSNAVFVISAGIMAPHHRVETTMALFVLMSLLGLLILVLGWAGIEVAALSARWQSVVREPLMALFGVLCGWIGAGLGVYFIIKDSRARSLSNRAAPATR